MGTSLTGLTPSTTYDALIKVGDNGPLSGTLKTLSDGLGNDSAISLSTGAASIAGTLAVSSSLTANSGTFSGSAADRVLMTRTSIGSWNLGISATNRFNIYDVTGAAERISITSAGNVGIGTATPSAKLEVVDANGIGVRIGDISAAPVSQTAVYVGTSTSGLTGGNGDLVLIPRTSDARNIVCYTGSGTPTLKTTITNDGYLRMAASTGGIQFNGDTASANALDDYEEGTWTMGISFGGASVGVTYASNTGSYTKIGRQVTVTGAIFLTSKGSSTGAATITGLPFTVGNSNANYSASALRFKNITFTNQFQGFANRNTTQIVLEEITVLGTVSDPTDADFANNSEIIVGLTYFV
jgi:hypothetical protein